MFAVLSPCPITNEDAWDSSEQQTGKVSLAFSWRCNLHQLLPHVHFFFIMRGNEFFEQVRKFSNDLSFRFEQLK